MAKLTAAGSLGATDSTVEMGTANAAQVGVNVTGTWTGTITFEARRGSTWENAAVCSVANPPAVVAATTTANVSRRIDTGGTNAVRARFSTATSGAPLIQFDGTDAAIPAAVTAVTADTELPAAAALSDATANPTAPMVGAALMGWDGGNWERNVLIAGGDAKNNALVGIITGAFNYLFNGTSWDRIRGTVAGLFVQGPVATGAAVPANPLYVGGSDGTNIQPLKTDTSGRTTVVGAAATGAAVTGNPVYCGASDGTNVQPLTVDSSKNLGIAVRNPGGSTGAVVATAADTQTNAAGLTILGETQDFNGTTWDRHRNNVDVTLLASAARTTLQNSGNLTTYNCKGVIVTVDVTATVSTVSLTPSINYIDPASGKTIPLLTATTIAATGTFTYWVNENALASVPAPYTKTAQGSLGRTFSINMAVGNANSQTYSIGYTLVP